MLDLSQLQARGNAIAILANQDSTAALLQADAMLDAMQAQQLPEAIAIALQTKVRVLQRLPNKTQAIALQNELIRYLKREQLPQNLAAAYWRLGQIYYDSLAFYRALDAWLKSLEIAGERQDIHAAARAYIGVGKFFFGLGEYTRALHCHNMAQMIASSLNLVQLDTEIGLNIAADAFRLQDFATALTALTKARAAFDAGLNRPSWLGEADFYQGMICFEHGEFAKAQEFLSRAYKIHHKQHNSWGESHVLLALARTFIKLAEYEHAVECLETVCALSEQHQQILLSIEAYEVLSMLYVEQGDYAKALQFHKRLHELIRNNPPEQRPGLRLSRHASQRLQSIESTLELVRIQARLKC